MSCDFFFFWGGVLLKTINSLMLTLLLLVCRHFITIVTLNGLPLLINMLFYKPNRDKQKPPERKQKGDLLSLSDVWAFSPYEKQKEA